MGGKEAGHRGHNRALKAERTAQSNESPRFRLHAQRNLLSSFGLDDCRMRMLEDLLTYLRQTKPPASFDRVVAHLAALPAKRHAG